MARAGKVLSVSAAVLSVGRIMGSSMTTCNDQQGCMDWHISGASCTGLTGECAWKVCMTVSDKPGCVKSGTISHTCEKPECSPGDWATSKEVKKFSMPKTMCQEGKAGAVLEFLLKDGKGCDTGRPLSTVLPPAPCSNQAPIASCAPSTARTCTGTGNIGKECIWTVTLPSECTCGSYPGTSATTTKETTTQATTTGSGVTTTGSGVTTTGSGVTTWPDMGSMPGSMPIKYDERPAEAAGAAAGWAAMCGGGALVVVGAALVAAVAMQARRRALGEPEVHELLEPSTEPNNEPHLG